jgi:hypothetical protein
LSKEKIGQGSGIEYLWQHYLWSTQWCLFEFPGKDSHCQEAKYNTYDFGRHHLSTRSFNFFPHLKNAIFWEPAEIISHTPHSQSEPPPAPMGPPDILSQCIPTDTFSGTDIIHQTFRTASCGPVRGQWYSDRLKNYYE